MDTKHLKPTDHGQTSALPTDLLLVSARDVANLNLRLNNFMLFKGPVFKGGPDVYLNGTAKDIYHQVIALNPDYVATFGARNNRNNASESRIRYNVNMPKFGTDPLVEGNASCRFLKFPIYLSTP